MKHQNVNRCLIGPVALYDLIIPLHFFGFHMK